MGVGAPHNVVEFVLVTVDKKHDYCFLAHHKKAGVRGPIYPLSSVTTGGEVRIDLNGKSYSSEMFPVKDSQYYAMARCPLEPGCSGLLATLEGKTVGVFLGMQEQDKVGIFVQPRRPHGPGIVLREVVGFAKRELFVSYEMYGRKASSKSKGKRKHRAVKGGRISQAEYEAVSRAFYEQHGRWATFHEIDELLDYQVAENDFFDEQEEEAQSLASFEVDSRYAGGDDFAADEGAFWDNEDAEDREEARLAQRFDVGGRNYAGNEPYYTPFGKKGKKVKGVDKVVIASDSNQAAINAYHKALKAQDMLDKEEEDVQAKILEKAFVVDHENGEPQYLDVSEEREPTHEELVAAFPPVPVTNNPFEDDVLVEEIYAKARADNKAAALAKEEAELREFRAWQASKAGFGTMPSVPVSLTRNQVSFAEVVRVKEFDGSRPAKEAPMPLTPEELKEKASKLVAKLSERPDAPAKAFKEFSANERMDEVRKKIQVIEDTGVRLNYVVELTGDERMKFPVNEHPYQILQKQLRLLRSREVALSNEKQRRATAEKEIKRAQKLLETRNLEIAELTAKLEQLKQSTEEVDF
jgi:hypothetical protein